MKEVALYMRNNPLVSPVNGLHELMNNPEEGALTQYKNGSRRGQNSSQGNIIDCVEVNGVYVPKGYQRFSVPQGTSPEDVFTYDKEGKPSDANPFGSYLKGICVDKYS